mgnify:FL=1
MRIGSTLKTAGFVINCSILAVLFALWTASEISPIEYVNMANYPSGYIEFTSAGGKLSVLTQYGGIACLPYSTLINPLLIWPGIVILAAGYEEQEARRLCIKAGTRTDSGRHNRGNRVTNSDSDSRRGNDGTANACPAACGLGCAFGQPCCGCLLNRKLLHRHWPGRSRAPSPQV